jgi:phosphate transport system substrate-binding protein
MLSHVMHKLTTLMRSGLTIGAIILVISSICAMPTSATDITVKGSDTMLVLSQQWAETYTKTHPDVKINVTGGGSATGIAGLLKGTADICNASWPMSAVQVSDFVEKFGKRPRQYKMCMDAVAIFVNKANPVEKLSLSQIGAIYTGKISNWKEVGGKDAPVSLYGRENSSGTSEFFKARVLARQEFAPTTKAMPGTAEVIQAVAKDPNAIGFGGIAYDHGVKHLAISKMSSARAFEPTEANVYADRYPLARYLFSYVKSEKDVDAVADYITWCLSDAGQAVVQAVGYFPLPKNLR